MLRRHVTGSCILGLAPLAPIRQRRKSVHAWQDIPILLGGCSGSSTAAYKANRVITVSMVLKCMSCISCRSSDEPVHFEDILKANSEDLLYLDTYALRNLILAAPSSVQVCACAAVGFKCSRPVYSVQWGPTALGQCCWSAAAHAAFLATASKSRELSPLHSRWSRKVLLSVPLLLAGAGDCLQCKTIRCMVLQEAGTAWSCSNFLGWPVAVSRFLETGLWPPFCWQ